MLAEVHNADEEDVRLRISRDITARVNHVGHARAVRLFPWNPAETSSGKLRGRVQRAVSDPVTAAGRGAPPRRGRGLGS